MINYASTYKDREHNHARNSQPYRASALFIVRATWRAWRTPGATNQLRRRPYQRFLRGAFAVIFLVDCARRRAARREMRARSDGSKWADGMWQYRGASLYSWPRWKRSTYGWMISDCCCSIQFSVCIFLRKECVSRLVLMFYKIKIVILWEYRVRFVIEYLKYVDRK